MLRCTIGGIGHRSLRAGLLVPAGTPHAIVGRLHQEIAKLMQSAEVKERLQSQGLDPVGSTPEEFAGTIRSEITKWEKVVKASGARAE